MQFANEVQGQIQTQDVLTVLADTISGQVCSQVLERERDMSAYVSDRERPHLKAHRRLIEDAPDLVASLEDEIRNYVRSRNEFNSSEAGKAILAKWPRQDEWSRRLGRLSGSVFGIVLLQELRDKWEIEDTQARGKRGKTYRKK